MGVCRAMVLSGNAKQATGEGKNGPVETRLTGPAATALHKQQQAELRKRVSPESLVTVLAGWLFQQQHVSLVLTQLFVELQVCRQTFHRS